jgi:MoxR-like ATPase
MVDEEENIGTKGFLEKTLRRFHSIFRSYDDRTRKAAMMRVSRRWKSKLDDGPKNKILTRRTRDERKQMHAKEHR